MEFNTLSISVIYTKVVPEPGTLMLAEPCSRALNGRVWIKTRRTHRERIKSGRVSMDVAMYNSSGLNGMLMDAEHPKTGGERHTSKKGCIDLRSV